MLQKDIDGKVQVGLETETIKVGDRGEAIVWSCLDGHRQTGVPVRYASAFWMVGSRRRRRSHARVIEQKAIGLAVPSRNMMNCRNECRYSIHLVADWPDLRRRRRHWRSCAPAADDTIPAGCGFRIRPVLEASESLVARAPDIWPFDQQLAPRRQH